MKSEAIHGERADFLERAIADESTVALKRARKNESAVLRERSRANSAVTAGSGKCRGRGSTASGPE
jgi:hypothetical protein